MAWILETLYSNLSLDSYLSHLQVRFRFMSFFSALDDRLSACSNWIHLLHR